MVREKVQIESVQRMIAHLYESGTVSEGKSNIYANDAVFIEPDRYPIPYHELRGNSFEIPTIVVFSDDAPNCNWAHPCRYFFFDADTDELYDTIDAQFPPFFLKDQEESNFIPMRIAVKIINSLLPPKFQLKIGTTKIIPEEGYNKYAILFSGLSNYRHVNDLEFAYRMLTDRYHFFSENIIVLNYNGSTSCGGYRSRNWPGDGSKYKMPVNNAGTSYYFSDALQKIAAQIQAGDLLFIHTSNHGGSDRNGSFICGYDEDDKFTSDDFGRELQNFPVFGNLMVMMEQCHSGGFIDTTITNSKADHTSIACACQANESSKGERFFDPFAFQWLSAMNLSDAFGGSLLTNPDLDNDAVITSQEAFDYAVLHKHPEDTPVYRYLGNGQRSKL